MRQLQNHQRHNSALELMKVWQQKQILSQIHPVPGLELRWSPDIVDRFSSLYSTFYKSQMTKKKEIKKQQISDLYKIYNMVYNRQADKIL